MFGWNRYSSKTSLEHRLDLGSSGVAALKATDALMLSSLSKLVMCTEKLSSRQIACV